MPSNSRRVFLAGTNVPKCIAYPTWDVTFSNAISKLRVQTSNISVSGFRTLNKREIPALRFSGRASCVGA